MVLEMGEALNGLGTPIRFLESEMARRCCLAWAEWAAMRHTRSRA
jgi:hypothetical protein